MSALPLDAVMLEIILNGLRSVTDETYIALMKSAFSTNIKERNDHSTALIDPEGRMLALCERSQPIHLSSMLGLTTTLLEKYRLEDFKPGDIFVSNDPYVAGGSHLPDVNLSMPVFVDGELLCFMCNIAHHADIGGMAPGSMSGGMSEIYQEGLRIPPIRLFKDGALIEDVLDLLLLNARVPEERRGDYLAQIASCKLGERRIVEFAAVHGRQRLIQAFDEIIARTEARMLAAIRQVPPGTYRFEDVMDDDGFGARNIPIKVAVTAGDPAGNGRIVCDFTGSSPVVRGNINVPYRALQSSVVYALRALLDPDVPSNQGMLDAIEIVAEPGSILNATFPAAVAGRANTCQRIIDVVLGALAPGLAGTGRGGGEWCQYGRRLRGHGRAGRQLRLSGNRGRRVRRSCREGRQGWRSGSSDQHFQPAGRGHRDRISAPGRELRLRSRFRRSRDASWRARPAARHPSRRSRRDIHRPGRALSQRAMGRLRRLARRPRALPSARCRWHRAGPADQAGADIDRPGRGL